LSWLSSSWSFSGARFISSVPVAAVDIVAV
jgi:hypothetical protein